MENVSMSQSEVFLKRRKDSVSSGIATFGHATAVSGKGAILIDADGRELIDLACGIGVIMSVIVIPKWLKRFKLKPKNYFIPVFMSQLTNPMWSFVKSSLSFFPTENKPKYF